MAGASVGSGHLSRGGVLLDGGGGSGFEAVPMIETAIDKLRVDFQPLAQAWQEIVQAYVFPLRFPGYKVRIIETMRSAERQAELLAKGASKLKVGLHQTGRAFDFGVFDDGGLYLPNDHRGVYTVCGQVAEVLGCEWGGRWSTFKDLGHIQFLRPGQTVHMALVEAGLVT
jgi:D-alanyl-D-alanine carboxypeptidase-like protein